MELEFTGQVFEWRGPAPYHFVAVPEDDALVIQDVAAALTYGWGMIPGTLRIGETTWTTSLWPKDGSFVVPSTRMGAAPGAASRNRRHHARRARHLGRHGAGARAGRHREADRERHRHCRDDREAPGL